MMRHNLGGLDADFVIKFDTSNGGPAPDAVTDRIYKLTIEIGEYLTVLELNCDIKNLGTQQFDVFNQILMCFWKSFFNEKNCKIVIEQYFLKCPSVCRDLTI